MLTKSEKRCEECGELLVLKNRRDLVRKRFCSRTCLGRSTARGRDMTYLAKAGNTPAANAKKSRPGSTNPNWRGGNTVQVFCEECGTRFTTTKTKRRQGYGKYCSQACGGKAVGRLLIVDRVSIRCVVCDKELKVLPHRARVQRTCSCRCSGILSNENMPTSGTQLEKAVAKILDDLRIEYKEQVGLLGITRVDFLVQPNIVIYADGDYWHSKPGVPERDALVDRRLIDAGYVVLRFSESQVHTEPYTVVEQLEEALNACCFV